MGRIIAWIAAVVHLVSGLWALISPLSFFENTAVFEPYNQHFVQDIGAFLTGLGAVLVIALVVTTDGLAVALLGVGAASAAHTVSHIVGADLGGEPVRDISMLVVMTAALLVAGWLRARNVPTPGS